VTFIHELIHVAFFVCGYYGDVEEFVEQEAQKFCAEHLDFAKSLFSRFKKEVKTSN
jgi:hypothetical protein